MPLSEDAFKRIYLCIPLDPVQYVKICSCAHPPADRFHPAVTRGITALVSDRLLGALTEMRALFWTLTLVAVTHYLLLRRPLTIPLTAVKLPSRCRAQTCSQRHLDFSSSGKHLWLPAWAVVTESPVSSDACRDLL
jgi:hypothetical protein